MKKIILILTLLIGCHVLCKAQSTELKQAFNQVNSTLKSYKFKSEDVYKDGEEPDYAYTRSINLKLQGGYLVFTINDDFTNFKDPFFGNKHGIKTLKAPIADTELLESDLEDGFLFLHCEDGLELTYKGQKELLKKYMIKGSPLNVKKLYKELSQMLSIAQEEEFKGNLGVSQQVRQGQARRRR